MQVSTLQNVARSRLLALAGLAVVGRLYNLRWGLPDIEEEALPMKKALEMWGWETGRLSFDPQTAGWPSLSFYVHLTLQHLHYGLGRLFGRFEQRTDYLVDYLADATELVTLSRAVGVLASAVIVYVGARLAWRLGGVLGGVLAGVTLAQSPLLLRESHLVAPDILLALFAALTMAKCLDYHTAGRRKDAVWAGIYMGLGIGCKYTPFLLAPSLYVIHLWRLKTEGATLRFAGLNDGRILWAGFACIAVFAVTSPYLLTNFDVVRRDFAYQALHMSEGHFGQDTHGIGLLYYVHPVLFEALGAGAALLGLTGLLYMAWRKRGAWLALLICVVPYYLGLAALSTRFPRYALPLLLPLAIGLAAWPVLLRARLAHRAPLRRAALLLLVVVVLVPTAIAAWRDQRLWSQPSTLQTARDWMLHNLGGSDAVLAMEAYTPELANLRLKRLSPVLLEKFSAEQRERLQQNTKLIADYIPMYSSRVGWAAFYYDLRHYLPYDYIVTSETVRGRYSAEAARFPEQMRFYAALERHTPLIQRVSPEDDMRGPEIRIYSMTDAARQSVLRERGAMPPDFYRPYLGRLYAPHYFSFVQSVAQRSAQKERWHDTALYYGVLVASASEQLPEQSQLDLVRRAAYAHLLAREFESARDFSQRYLRVQPQAVDANSYLARALEGLGDLDGARRVYQRCVDVARATDQAEWVGWGLEQLARLEGAGTLRAP